MRIFTSYHPALFALQALHDQFPGVLELYVFCNDEGARCYNTEGKNKQLFTPVDRSSGALSIKVQQFRAKRKKIFWGDKEDLPLAPRKKQLKQLSIQDEIEQNVLVFSIPSQNDDAFDVFAVCFSKTFSNFYIPNGRNVLSSELKKSIGQTVAGQIEWLYQLHHNQQQNIERIQQAYHQNALKLKETDEALTREKATTDNLLSEYLNQLIDKHELALDCTIQLAADFLSTIRIKQIEIDAIEQLVADAVTTAYDLALDNERIELTANLLKDTKQHAASTKSYKLQELDKTEQLLHRYEEAAELVAQKSLAVNGKNLAKQLNISGPAITDAIKKHALKITRLMEKHPDRWPLISDYIRPLREIKLQALRKASGK